MPMNPNLRLADRSSWPAHWAINLACHRWVEGRGEMVGRGERCACVRACSLRAHSPVSLPCRRMQGEPSCAPARRSASAAQSAHALVSPLPRELECHATGTHRCGIRWRQSVCVLRLLTRVLWPRLERRRGRARAHHTAKSSEIGASGGILAQHQTVWDEARKPAYSSGLPTTPV